MLKKVELPRSENRQRGIRHSLSAYHECLEAAAYMVDHGGKLAGSDHVTLLHDCADANLMLANSLSRGSAYYGEIATLAHGISTECSDLCARFEHHHGQLKVCFGAVLRAAMTTARLAGLSHEDDEPDDQLRDRILKGTFPASDPPASSVT